jgi:hypothetical protein
MYREGVVTVLSAASHVVEAPKDHLAWSGRGHDGLVLLTPRHTSASWEALRRLRAATDECPVIAMLADESAAAGAKAVRPYWLSRPMSGPRPAATWAWNYSPRPG